MSDLPISPAADRNKQPILEALRQLLPASGEALEIASGTGQHVVWFAAGLPGWNWQPTDAEAPMLPVIAARAAAAGVANVRPALLLDVLATTWPVCTEPAGHRYDLIYCANMLHIAPWATCAALMHGAARCLAPAGVLITYGPYLEDGVITSAGNLAFDDSLRARNADWGLRRREEVEQEARRAGLALHHRRAMPANNLLLAFAPRIIGVRFRLFATGRTSQIIGVRSQLFEAHPPPPQN